jgi:rubrerythrin
MALSDPWAVVIAAAIAAAVSVFLARRTSHAKRDALEMLVADAVDTADRNHKDEITRIEKQNRERVEWLQSQITYYQQMSAPPAQRPDHPPVDL